MPQPISSTSFPARSYRSTHRCASSRGELAEARREALGLLVARRSTLKLGSNAALVMKPHAGAEREPQLAARERHGLVAASPASRQLFTGTSRCSWKTSSALAPQAGQRSSLTQDLRGRHGDDEPAATASRYSLCWLGDLVAEVPRQQQHVVGRSLERAPRVADRQVHARHEQSLLVHVAVDDEVDQSRARYRRSSGASTPLAAAPYAAIVLPSARSAPSELEQVGR